MRHVEAFGRADLGVDQPLLEVSEGGAEPLLQQPLLVLALTGRPEAEAGGTQEEGRRRKEGRKEGMTCLIYFVSFYFFVYGSNQPYTSDSVVDFVQLK